MILVINANAARCRLFTLNKAKNQLTFYKEIKSNGHMPEEPASLEGKEIKTDDFYREIAKELNQERNQQHIQEIVVVAPPHLYGLLHHHCNKHVNELMTKIIQKDLMHLSDSHLMDYLKDEVKYSA